MGRSQRADVVKDGWVLLVSLPLVLSGCLAGFGDQHRSGTSTLQLQGTVLIAVLDISDAALRQREETTLTATITNEGTRRFSYTNAGCPGEAFLFDVEVDGERIGIAPSREGTGSACVTIPRTLEPGQSVTHSEPWRGEIWDADADRRVRLAAGTYDLIGWLNHEEEVGAHAPITIV